MKILGKLMKRLTNSLRYIMPVAICLLLLSCNHVSDDTDEHNANGDAINTAIIEGNGENASVPGAPTLTAEPDSTSAERQSESGLGLITDGTQATDYAYMLATHYYNLPIEAPSPEDFAAPGWKLMDVVELDYNGDGRMDIVGVLDYDEGGDASNERPFDYRILFAAAKTGVGSYRLDFQDVNLIKTRLEGGTFGDPYMPLVAEGNSFTINSYGGSAWKWRLPLHG